MAAGEREALRRWTSRVVAASTRTFDESDQATADAEASLEALPVEVDVLARAAVFSDRPSIAEVVALTGRDVTLVVAAFDRAVSDGVVSLEPDGTVRFGSDGDRSAAVERLPLADRLATHAAARDLLARDGRDVERVVAATAHGLVASSRSAADAERAVELSRVTGARLAEQGEPAAAAASLGAALDIVRRQLPNRPRAGLLVELAGLLLAAGRLRDARRAFRSGVAAAELEDAPRELARAALGMGGIWLNEHPASDEAAYLSGLLQRSLDILAEDGDPVLRARLALRLAAEQTYRSGRDLGVVRDALQAVRATGDLEARAEGLSLVHHLLLGPHLRAEREALTAELFALLGQGISPLLTLMALCWRTVDHVLAGDPAAPRSVGELHLRAEELQCEGLVYLAEVMKVMLTIRSGRLDAASVAAQACYERGCQVGDADAPTFLIGHLAAIRYFEGREAEAAAPLAQACRSPALADGERSLVAAAALFAWRAGDAAPARAVLAGVADGDLPITSSSWLPAVATYAELAHLLEDERAAEVVYGALAPFARLPVIASVGVACFGPVERALALAALTRGDHAQALAHAGRAVTAAEQLGHRPAVAVCEGLLAQVLAATGDVELASRHLDRAQLLAHEMGMTGWAERWQAEADDLRAARRPPRLRFERLTGGGWRVVLGATAATVGNMPGVAFLAQLVDAAGRDVPALVLRGSVGDQATHQPLLDRAALRDLRDRSDALRAQLESCEPWERPALEDELDQVLRAIRLALGLHGRGRAFADGAERARTGVRKAITRAIGAIERIEPAIAEHLRASVTTGRSCRYEPT